MLVTAIASLVVGLTPLAADGPVCPVMGSPVNSKIASVDYAGVRYGFCCGGCDANFQKDPSKFLKAESNKGKVLGVSLFDPVAGAKVDLKKHKEFSDFNGVRYYFVSTANKSTFDKAPKTYGTIPAKEALYCPVMGHEVKDYASSGGYVDHEGVRYYICCAGCLSTLKTDVAKLAPGAKEHVKAPKGISVKAG